MKYLLLAILIILILAAPGFFYREKIMSNLNLFKEEKVYDIFNEEKAKALIDAWAKDVNGSLDKLQNENGDFFGMVGSLAFEYQKTLKKLIVRAYVFPHSDSFNSKEYLLPYLNEIALKDPDSVSGGLFESSRGRWERDEEASLFLKLEFTDPKISSGDFLNEIKGLREAALVWKRVKLTEVLDSLVKERRGIR